MRKMKRMAALFLSAVAAFSCSACSGGSSGAVSGTAASGKMARIDVVQLVEHEALDADYQGFVAGLKAAGYEQGKNLKIDFENAQGEQANCITIANKFVADRPDLILAIATTAAQVCANSTKQIPILVTAITDPATAKLVQSNEKPGDRKSTRLNSSH